MIQCGQRGPRKGLWLSPCRMWILMSSSPLMQPLRTLTRREALSRLALGAAGVAGACKLGPSPELPNVNNGRLAARPASATTTLSPGMRRLLISGGRDGLVYLPASLSTATPVPLVLMLHGAGGNGDGIYTPLQSLADETGFILLAPDSRGRTWDAIQGFYSGDVDYINAALEWVFQRCNVDPQRIGIAGFSDGATYAIGLGRINGDLFQRVVAFSPGFLIPASDAFKPPMYITHGLRDEVLPLDFTSRIIVEELSSIGYDITFREFDGGHWIPAAYAAEALGWLIGGTLPPPSA